MSPMQIWLLNLHSTMDRESPHDLFAILRGANRNEDLTVPVVNNAKRFVQRLFEGKQAKIALYLYYRLLHGILQRFVLDDDDPESSLSFGMRETLMQRLCNSHFHNALLCCAAEIVAHAFQGKIYPWATQCADRLSYSVDLWMVVVYVLDVQDILKLPSSIISFLEDVQLSVIRDHCFMHHSSVYMYLLEGGGCLHLSGETSMIKQFLKEFAKLTLDLTNDLVESISTKIHLSEALSCMFINQCMDLTDLVMFHHLYLFFERSIFVPILCCIYCVGKMGKMQVSFKLLTQECAARFPTIQLTSFGSISMTNPTDASPTMQCGTIWQFYNEIFLSTCRDEIDEIFQNAENAARFLSTDQL